MKRITIGLLCFVFLLTTGFSVLAADPITSKENKGTSSKAIENIKVDVLIIGAGAAGLAAGAAAKAKLRDAGRVLILEKKSATGGNSALNIRSPIRVPGTGSGMPGMQGPGGGQGAATDPKTVADAQTQKIIDYTHWRVDMPVVRRLIEESQTSTDWLWSLLSEDEKQKLKDAQSSGQQQGPQSGERYSTAMTRLCRNLGVEIMTDTKATKLLTDKSGAVIGVLAEGKDKDYNISAAGVVIATGGFIGNLELMKKYFLPSDDNLYNEIYIKGEKHTGDGILMAGEIGAALDATVAFETTFEPIPWEISDVETLRSFANSGRNGELIWLDGKGKRFARESETDALNSRQGLYHKAFYIVFDENIKQHIINKKSSGQGGMPGMAGGPTGAAGTASGAPAGGAAPAVSGAPAGGAMPGGMGQGAGQSYDDLDKQLQKQIDKGYAVKTNSLDELAKWIGCYPEILKKTIKEYNESCEKGYDNLLLKPAASLIAMNKAPYYAIKNKLAIHLTHGPLRVNEDLQVVDKNHDPINGLYAAGSDIGGVENDTYAGSVPAHSSGWALAGGRIAGENAAEYSKSKK
jgi:fumarate reductase flavoprotein subunit